MKARFVLFASAFLLLLSCGKEEFATTSPALQTAGNDTYIRMINFSGIPGNNKVISINETRANVPAEVTLRSSNSNSTNGHFAPLPGWTFTFNGIKNNGGVHGNVTLDGPIANFRMAADCLIFEGNEVVYGGVITEVIFQDPSFCGGCLAPGVYTAFKLKDNGEGQNAPPDQFSTWMLFGYQSLCDLFPISAEEYGAYVDVSGLGGQIQVK